MYEFKTESIQVGPNNKVVVERGGAPCFRCVEPTYLLCRFYVLPKELLLSPEKMHLTDQIASPLDLTSFLNQRRECGGSPRATFLTYRLCPSSNVRLMLAEIFRKGTLLLRIQP